MRRFLHTHSASDPHVREAEEDKLARHWGIAECARCGRTLVLGEPLHRRAGEVVCDTCFGAAPERPVPMTAPARLTRRPSHAVMGRRSESGESGRAA